MSKLGNIPISQAFVTDQFSGTGSQTTFTMSVAPAATSAVLVAISGVLQDPSTYAVSGTTLTFSAAPPSGTGNISARYLGIPASGVATTAYRTVTEFTATSGQTTFTVPSYVAGFINVYRNGAMLGTADYTATNGTTVVLAVGAVAGDLIAVESFYVSSVLNAIPNTPRSVSAANMPVGSVLQVVSATKTDSYSQSTTSYTNVPGLSVSITPTANTSKILVFATLCMSGGIAGSHTMFAAFAKNGTQIGAGAYGTSYPASPSTDFPVSHSFSYLDSPATASATTYTVQISCDNTTTVYVNRSQTRAGIGASTLIAMEIAA